MLKQKGFVNYLLVAYCAIVVLAIGGWIANVVKIVGALGGDITAMFVARCVGVLAAPLGAVLGYF